MAEFTLKS